MISWATGVESVRPYLASTLLWNRSEFVDFKNEPILWDKLLLFRACRGNELITQTVELGVVTVETAVGTGGMVRCRFIHGPLTLRHR